MRTFRLWPLRAALATMLLLALLLGRAGFEDSRILWYFATASGILLAATFVLSPELLRERLSARQPTIDPGRLAAIRLLVLAHLVVSIYDVGHFPSRVPMTLSQVCLALFGLGLAWVMWAMSVNPFFVASVRLQPERGHRVIDRGPYRFVRHPGYLGMAVVLPASALALGSWWGLIPAAAASLLFVWRAADEDRFLRERLDGYSTYAGRVRFRLVPGAW